MKKLLFLAIVMSFFGSCKIHNSLENKNKIYGNWFIVDANGNSEIPNIGTTYMTAKIIPEMKKSSKIEKTKFEPLNFLKTCPLK